MKSFKEYICEDAVADQNAIWKDMSGGTWITPPKRVNVRGTSVKVKTKKKGGWEGGYARQRIRDVVKNAILHPIRTLRNPMFAIDASPYKKVTVNKTHGRTEASLLGHELQHVSDSLKPKSVEQQSKFGKHDELQRKTVPYYLRDTERSARRGEAVVRARNHWHSLLSGLQSDRDASHLRTPEAFRNWVDNHAKSGAHHEFHSELGKTQNQHFNIPRKKKFTLRGLTKSAGRLSNQYYKAFYNRPDGLSVDNIYSIVTSPNWKIDDKGTPVKT